RAGVLIPLTLDGVRSLAVRAHLLVGTLALARGIAVHHGVADFPSGAFVDRAVGGTAASRNELGGGGGACGQRERGGEGEPCHGPQDGGGRGGIQCTAKSVDSVLGP